MKKLTHILTEEREAFSGTNHAFIAIGLFLALLLIPVPPFSTFVKTMTSTPLFAVLTFFIAIGGALLPDIDNPKNEGGSAASWDLGIIGSILSTGMVTISSVVTTIFHGKRDVKPMTQHRFLWHTPLIAIIGWVLIWQFVPDTKLTVIKAWPHPELSVIIVTIMVAISIYCGSIFFLKKIAHWTPLKTKHAEALSMILMVSAIIICITSPYYQVKMFGYCIILGYAFHICSDALADSGIPLLFPIPILGQFWKRICFIGPFSIKTGSTIESLCKIIFFVIDIILAYFVISKVTGFTLF